MADDVADSAVKLIRDKFAAYHAGDLGAWINKQSVDATIYCDTVDRPMTASQPGYWIRDRC